MARSSTIDVKEFGLVVGAEPVRKIKPRTGRKTMPGWFPTRKGTLPLLRTESTLEIDGIGHFEVNPDCVLMAAQPHVLVYHEPQPDGTTIRRSYTPDLAILMRDGEVVVVDFKVARFARHPRWQAKAELIAEAYERDHFATFSVVTDEAIYVQPRHRNVGILLAHRAIVRDGEALVAVRGAVAALGLPTTIDAVRQLVHLPSASEHVDRTLTALATMASAGEVRFDLGRPLLGPGAPLLPPGELS